MMAKKLYMLNIILLIFLLFLPIALSQELPKSLQSAIEANKRDAESNVRNISFLIAFLAGFISLLSPCTATTLPAFFAFAFKEKKDILKVMLAFSAGFMLVFIILGIIAAYIGKSLLFLQEGNATFAKIAGFILIGLGIMMFFGKGFSSFIKTRKVHHDYFGIFLLGIFFVIGWSACLGPILVGILVMATYLHNFLYAALLFFFYGVGLLVPLFVIAGLYDKYDMGNRTWMQGKTFYLGKFAFNTSNMIGGLLLIIMGAIVYIYKGTWKINTYDLFGGLLLFYKWQRELIGSTIGNVLGGLLLILFIVLMFYFFRKNNSKNIISKDKLNKGLKKAVKR